MAGVDERNKHGGIKRIQTGLFYLPRLRTDLFFVTLEKLESEYSPTTLYNDHPMTPTLFHWESQSGCHAETKTGRRHIACVRGADHHALLFVRERRHDARGETMPYVLLGPVYYRSHQGGRPMEIEWELELPMQARMFQELKVAAG
ncbi:MAG: DUF3427 domain-containing protein [Myxococcota bacterium]